jgi:hypothetical protein
MEYHLAFLYFDVREKDVEGQDGEAYIPKGLCISWLRVTTKGSFSLYTRSATAASSHWLMFCIK